MIVSIRRDVDDGTFQFPAPCSLNRVMGDILDEVVDGQYYLTPAQIENIYKWKAQQRPFRRVTGRNSICPTLTARGAGEYHSGMILYSRKLVDTSNLDDMNVLHNPLEIRTITPKESFRLMGFTDSDVDTLVKHGIPKAQIYKLAGNSIVVNVLEHLFKQLYPQDRVIELKKKSLSLLDSL